MIEKADVRAALDAVMKIHEVSILGRHHYGSVDLDAISKGIAVRLNKGQALESSERELLAVLRTAMRIMVLRNKSRNLTISAVEYEAQVNEQTMHFHAVKDPERKEIMFFVTAAQGCAFDAPQDQVIVPDV